MRSVTIITSPAKPMQCSDQTPADTKAKKPARRASGALHPRANRANGHISTRSHGWDHRAAEISIRSGATAYRYIRQLRPLRAGRDGARPSGRAAGN